MHAPAPVGKAALFDALPPPWPEPLRETIRTRVVAGGRKVVVLDDDPTGTQTVHGVPVLTEWSVPSLTAELAGEGSLFFVLTNSRSMPLAAAQQLNREIGNNLVAASKAAGREFVVISRSDSTLRGHFPGETDALAEALGVPFDGQLLIPAFFEGGRYTVGDEHYVEEAKWLVPAAETPFAQDATFGYRSSNLREWVAEKSEGGYRSQRGGVAFPARHSGGRCCSHRCASVRAGERCPLRGQRCRPP